MTLREQITRDVADGGAFFDTATGFAEDATWTPTAQAARTLKIVWQDPFELSDVQGQFENRALSFLVRSSAVDGMRRGESIVRAGVTYYVLHVEHDGTGVARVFVSKEKL